MGETKDRAKAAGLSWPLAPELTDDQLAPALYRRTAPPGQLGRRCKPEPDWAASHLEKKRPHVTLQILSHMGYLAAPGGGDLQFLGKIAV